MPVALILGNLKPYAVVQSSTTPAAQTPEEELLGILSKCEVSIYLQAEVQAYQEDRLQRCLNLLDQRCRFRFTLWLWAILLSCVVWTEISFSHPFVNFCLGVVLFLGLIYYLTPRVTIWIDFVSPYEEDYDGYPGWTPPPVVDVVRRLREAESRIELFVTQIGEPCEVYLEVKLNKARYFIAVWDHTDQGLIPQKS